MNLVFYEMKNRMPMYTAEVPEGFSGEISYTMRQFQVTENFAVRGTAGAEGKAYRLYFQVKAIPGPACRGAFRKAREMRRA